MRYSLFELRRLVLSGSFHGNALASVKVFGRRTNDVLSLLCNGVCQYAAKGCTRIQSSGGVLVNPYLKYGASSFFWLPPLLFPRLKLSIGNSVKASVKRN